jgi:monoamine oxidase
MGSVLKVNAIYPEPFWRAQGLNGDAVTDAGPLQIVFDNSPPQGRPGVLVGFAEGDESRALLRASSARRRALALGSLERLFGAAAARPRGYVDMLWTAEPFTRGAYGSFNPPGVLTSLGPATAGAIGPVHLAGADLSAEWPGYMEGAIRSGASAARAVLAEL